MEGFHGEGDGRSYLGEGLSYLGFGVKGLAIWGLGFRVLWSSVYIRGLGTLG